MKSNHFEFQAMLRLAWGLLFLIAFTVEANAQFFSNGPFIGTNSPGQATLPVEGGEITYTLDTQTPVSDLIKRLENWKEVETGKGYWLGYTNDMFSIAAHGDEALPTLIDYIHSPASLHAKQGAVDTIHLIGIHSHVSGRLYEEFTDPTARQALLSVLDEPGLTETVVSLLMRDPQSEDVPVAMQALRKAHDGNWAIVNALVNRYQLRDLPLGGPLPDAIGEIKIFRSQERFKNSPDFPLTIIRVLHEQVPDKVQIEPALVLQGISPKQRAWGPDSTLTLRQTLQPIIGQEVFSYCMIGYPFQYYVEKGVLYFCSAQTAAARLLSWYAQHKSEYVISDQELQKRREELAENVKKTNELDQRAQVLDAEHREIFGKMKKETESSPAYQTLYQQSLSISEQLDAMGKERMQLVNARKLLQ